MLSTVARHCKLITYDYALRSPGHTLSSWLWESRVATGNWLLKENLFLIQVAHWCDWGCQQILRLEWALLRSDCASYCWQCMRAYHSHFCCPQGQDGSSTGSGFGLLHPGTAFTIPDNHPCGINPNVNDSLKLSGDIRWLQQYRAVSLAVTFTTWAFNVIALLYIARLYLLFWLALMICKPKRLWKWHNARRAAGWLKIAVLWWEILCPENTVVFHDIHDKSHHFQLCQIFQLGSTLSASTYEKHLDQSVLEVGVLKVSLSPLSIALSAIWTFVFLQIACFVLPVIVLVGWIVGPVHGKEPFSLDFDAFITLILTLSVIHAYFVSSDGTSNWLAGVQLCTTYVLIALLYLFISDSGDEPPKWAHLQSEPYISSVG